jgi:hypothetical protein
MNAMTDQEYELEQWLKRDYDVHLAGSFSAMALAKGIAKKINEAKSERRAEVASTLRGLSHYADGRELRGRFAQELREIKDRAHNLIRALEQGAEI